jgi:hypothetical protein
MDSLDSWIAHADDQTPWYQLDLGSTQWVSGVVTAGRFEHNWWTTAYNVRYSDTDGSWDAAPEVVFDEANTDRNTPFRAIFPDGPVLARFIRIFPTSWSNSAPALRVGVLLCGTVLFPL